MQEFQVSDPKEVRKARMSQLKNRKGSLVFNGKSVFGTVFSIFQKSDKYWTIKFAIEEKRPAVGWKGKSIRL